MTPWQRFARRRLAITRWQCEPEHIPADQQTAFDDAFARQCQLEKAVVEVAAGTSLPDSVLESVATSLASWLDGGHFSADERQTVVRHHARMEWQFAEIAVRAPLPDDLQVLAWYQQHQVQFMRPPQRLTSHLLLTVDKRPMAQCSARSAIFIRILASRVNTLPGWRSATPTAPARLKAGVWAG